MIRAGFVSSQAISGFAIFAVPLFNYFSSQRDPEDSNQSESSPYLDYALTIGVSALAASLYGFGANYFQGKRITDDDEADDTADTDRTLTSNSAEITFLLLRTCTLAVENVFVVSALKAYYLVLTNHADEQLASASLSNTELAATLLYTLIAELPFLLATEGVEACEQIKRSLTGAGNDPLINAPLSLLANCPGRHYIKVVGTSAHVAGHASEVLLLVPAHAYLRLLKQSPFLFGLALSTHGLMSLYLISFNALQTYLFEAKEGARHLSDIQGLDTSSLQTSVTVSARHRHLVEMGLYAQGPLHGTSDAVTLIIAMRKWLRNSSPTIQAAAISGPAVFQFAASTAGNLASEVKESIEGLKTDEATRPLLSPA